MDAKDFSEEEARSLKQFEGTSYGRLLKNRFKFRRLFFTKDDKGKYSIKEEIKEKFMSLDYPILIGGCHGKFYLKRAESVKSNWDNDQILLKQLSKLLNIPLDFLDFYSIKGNNIKNEPKFEEDKREG